jgi:phospholipid/cholesterol/gamma-HCH transport system substrate-binding protein
VSGNAKAATQDLGALRAEVDASLRKVNGLIEEINRKWPFRRDSEIRLALISSPRHAGGAQPPLDWQ